MMRPVRSRLAGCAAGLVVVAALAGCAQSSDSTTSGSPGGSAPPTASTPTTASTPSAPGATTSTTVTGSGTVTASPPPGGGTLTVTPSTGSTHSVLHFTFTSAHRVASQSGDLVSQALSVTGPQKNGCVGIHQQAVPMTVGGQPMTVALGPAQLGGAWCPGSYEARVEVVERPKCGAGMMCPQFIRVAAVIGPVSFKISG
jgi:hypothetical protein